MKAKEVVKKILADAGAEAEQITTATEAKLSAEKVDFDKKLAAFEKETARLAAEAAADKKARALATARMENSRNLLAMKRGLFDEIFVKARQQLGSLPDVDYTALMSKLMVKAAEAGEQEVIVDKAETRIDDAFIEKVNGRLKDKAVLRLSKIKAEIGSGFILRRGNVRTNASAEVMVNLAREEMESELAKELFS